MSRKRNRRSLSCQKQNCMLVLGLFLVLVMHVDIHLKFVQNDRNKNDKLEWEKLNKINWAEIKK